MENARTAVRVHYDFASTICYVAHRVLERIAGPIAALGVELVWSPVDLTLLCGWERGESLSERRHSNAHRVAQELGVPVRMPSTWLDSRRAHAVALEVAGRPAEAAWRERVWTAVFEEARPLDAPGELERLARDVELELPDRMGRRLDELEVRTRLAAEEQVTGAPTFMLGEWPLGGIQEDATMLELLRRFVERRAASRP